MEIIKYKKEVLNKLLNMGISHQDAEDIFQTVCVLFLNQTGIENVRAWLHTAIKNRALNHIRDNKNTMLPGEDWIKMQESEYQQYSEIKLDLTVLHTKQRFIIDETLNGLTQTEIAEKHKLNRNSVKASYRQAVMLLRKRHDNDSQ